MRHISITGVLQQLVEEFSLMEVVVRFCTKLPTYHRARGPCTTRLLLHQAEALKSSGNVYTFITTRNESCSEVIFLYLSVILFTGGLCHTAPRADTPLGRHTPRADTPWDRHPPWADTPLAQCMLGSVNKRAVRILLECILVYYIIYCFD